MLIKYDPELKAKAVRLFQDHVAEYPSRWAAMKAISARLGMTAETLRQWIKQAEVDAGQAPGLSSDSADELRAGRPAQIEAGDRQNLPFAVNIDGVTFQVPGLYSVVFSIDNVEINRLAFRVVGPPAIIAH